MNFVSLVTTMFKRHLSGLCFVPVVLAFPLSAMALDPIPEDSGFNGFLRLGGGLLNYESNLVAGNSFMDVSNDTITSFTQSPDSETEGIPTFDGALNYTFASTRTQLTFGSQTEDIARLENAQQLAVKQELPDKSLLSLGALFSTIPTEVWKDPYLTGTPREETDRDSMGVKFAFDKILGSGLQFIYTYREIEIDDEESGNSVGSLTIDERELLHREGDHHKYQLYYRFNIDNSHFIEPSVAYFDQKKYGDAMANDGYEFHLSYFYLGTHLTFVATGMFGNADYDKENPLYGQTREDDLYLFGLQVYYREPFGWKPFKNANFSVYCSFSYYYEDANIDFYDTELNMVDAGVMFRF